jgi:hypothetical protein
MSFLNNPSNLNKLRNGKISEQYLNQMETFLRNVFTKIGVVTRLDGFTVSNLPDAGDYEGSMVYCTNETGGAVPVFSDGTNWRRVTDRAIASA